MTNTPNYLIQYNNTLDMYLVIRRDTNKLVFKDHDWAECVNFLDCVEVNNGLSVAA